jgi:hypothetical protein
MSRNEGLTGPTNITGSSSPTREKTLPHDVEIDGSLDVQNNPACHADRSDITYLTGSRFWLVITTHVELAVDLD